MSRVIAIHLDGYDAAFEQRMIAGGELPALARLDATSARFALDHGFAKYTGISGEHVATGLTPERAGRFSSITFNPRTYSVKHFGAVAAPFAEGLSSRTVVFDVPYLSLASAHKVRGVSGWGAHDPGVGLQFSSAELRAQFMQRFGEYPASETHYRYGWPSGATCRTMGNELAEANELRAQAAHWLLTEGVADWDLALLGISESHAATEAFWHGVDEQHPLHGVPSAAAAAEALRQVYRAIDRMIGQLAESFPDASFVVFSMHGMGANWIDTTAMMMVPELMYRYAFGKPFFPQPKSWSDTPEGQIVFPDHLEYWEACFMRRYPRWRPSQWRRIARNRLPAALVRRYDAWTAEPENAERGPIWSHLHWMPTLNYQAYWPAMPAFCLPAFQDVRIRLNVAGRESKGIVAQTDYQRVCDDIERVLNECLDGPDGRPAVSSIVRPHRQDPMAVGATQADLIVHWHRPVQSLVHARLGTIGPIPFRRPGGHSGGLGLARIRAATVSVGHFGERSAFDVVPTLIDLLGEPVPGQLSGRSLLEGLARTPNAPIKATVATG